jgi:hypothetical protein
MKSEVMETMVEVKDTKLMKTKRIVVTMVAYVDIEVEVPGDLNLETEESESHPDFMVYKEVHDQILQVVRGHAKELEWEPSLEHPLVLVTGVGNE